MMELRITSNSVEYRVLKEEGDQVAVSRADGGTERLRFRVLPDGAFEVEGMTGIVTGHTVRDGGTAWAHVKGRTYRFELVRANRSRAAAAGDLSSPMPGQVQRLLVIEGDTVQAGQALLVVEAMKMQLEIKAPHAGTVRRLLARQSQQVEAGVPLVELDEIVAITPARPGKRSP
jgi:biotin carboxyl carrier protein